ncbi:glutamate racemase [Thalassotalea ponticola]|uniref:glutamate racemase n=1 Tax=Thalassotalea ponticola TaxID=1523392 RepID=UPI0025B41DE7|nr:glutamate racemase [Thalassotalea ponticola]
MASISAANTIATQYNFTNRIGIFDSGVGGLSIYQGITQRLANERLVYIGDNAHAPYGEKSLDYILQRCRVICRFMQQQGAKAIVVACNTATVSVISRLRDEFELPIIGVEPAVKPAALASKTGHVGVFATRATLASPSFNNLMSKYKQQVDFHTVACRGLVEAIETLPHNSEQLNHLLAGFVSQVTECNIDGLVLGCTHYPFVRQQISRLLPAGVDIFDTSEAVARQVETRLLQSGLVDEQSHDDEDVFLTTGQEGVVAPLFSALLNKSTKVKHIDI